MTSTYQAVVRTDSVIRALVPEDLADVLEMEVRSYSHPWSEAVFRDCFRPDYRLYACDCGAALGGYAIVAYLFDEAHLLNLCVPPERRREGVGRQLLRYLIARAAHEGMKQALLEVRVSNLSAIALYESEGFRGIGRRPGYYPAADGREDASVMAIDLCVI
ncbi:ribosomal protein S18-alanine N-acetyltransferase [Marinobacter sp.]|uniref:ribosomal protein S18-alanine N-acetyltransferase n=1 Tax=Marinobacter sp. TaxID=50741 RepID=UPI0034A45090